MRSEMAGIRVRRAAVSADVQGTVAVWLQIIRFAVAAAVQIARAVVVERG